MTALTAAAVVSMALADVGFDPATVTDYTGSGYDVAVDAPATIGTLWRAREIAAVWAGTPPVCLWCFTGNGTVGQSSFVGVTGTKYATLDDLAAETVTHIAFAVKVLDRKCEALLPMTHACPRHAEGR